MTVRGPRRQARHARTGRWRARSTRRDERGATALEFGLLAPLMLLLVFGMISYGTMLSYRQALSQGATEGARAAAVLPSSTPAAKVTAAVAALNESLQSYGVQCTIPGTATAGNLVRGGTTVGTCAVTVAACTNNAAASCATVVVDHAYRANPLVPTVPGLGIVVPQSLAYTAVAQVS